MTIQLEDVKDRLAQMGYQNSDTDDVVIQFSIDKTEEYIKNFCNIEEVPEELKYSSIDWVCGDFLNLKRSTGQLEGFDVEQALASISLGDMNISYNGQSESQLLDVLIGKLRIEGQGELICFRSIKW